MHINHISSFNIHKLMKNVPIILAIYLRKIKALNDAGKTGTTKRPTNHATETSMKKLATFSFCFLFNFNFIRNTNSPRRKNSRFPVFVNKAPFRQRIAYPQTTRYVSVAYRPYNG